MKKEIKKKKKSKAQIKKSQRKAKQKEARKNAKNKVPKLIPVKEGTRVGKDIKSNEEKYESSRNPRSKRNILFFAILVASAILSFFIF